MIDLTASVSILTVRGPFVAPIIDADQIGLRANPGAIRRGRPGPDQHSESLSY